MNSARGGKEEFSTDQEVTAIPGLLRVLSDNNFVDAFEKLWKRCEKCTKLWEELHKMLAGQLDAKKSLIPNQLHLKGELDARKVRTAFFRETPLVIQHMLYYIVVQHVLLRILQQHKTHVCFITTRSLDVRNILRGFR